MKGQSVYHRFHRQITDRIPQNISQILFFLKGYSQPGAGSFFPYPLLLPQMAKDTMQHQVKICPVYLSSSLTEQPSQPAWVIIKAHPVSAQALDTSVHLIHKRRQSHVKKTHMQIQLISGRHQNSGTNFLDSFFFLSCHIFSPCFYSLILFASLQPSLQLKIFHWPLGEIFSLFFHQKADSLYLAPLGSLRQDFIQVFPGPKP